MFDRKKDIVKNGKYTDKQGTLRFAPNPLIDYMINEGQTGEPVDLNKLWIRAMENEVPRKYMKQLYRLMGYSVSGYYDISFDRLPK